jgi:enamine deaminase RidA (YjgF/YER057c/UK114 family)
MTGRAGGSGAEARMRAAGIVLPEPFRPVGSYIEARRWHDQLFMSGAGPVEQDGRLVTGKVGADISLVEAQHAARLTGLQLLAIAREQLGTLDRIAAVLRVFGMVNCAPGFTDTPEVLDGCSEVLLEVLGPEIGAHARAAVGMAELPRNISVEIEMIVGITD